jgi:hypothetical protein
MRVLLALLASMFVSIAEPVAADTNTDAQNYAAKCKAASFARWGPGTLSTAMRNAEIQRCIRNKGFLD